MEPEVSSSQSLPSTPSQNYFKQNRSAVIATLGLVLILPVTLLAVSNQTRLGSKANQFPVTPVTPTNTSSPVTAYATLTPTPTITTVITPATSKTPTPITTTTTTPTNTPVPTLIPLPVQTQITVYAAGTQALGRYPNINLLINGSRVKQWTNISGDPVNRVFTKLDYTHPTSITSGSKIRVQFTNDRYIPGVADRNLFVDKIMVGNSTLETEAPSVFGRGVWNSGRCRNGNFNSEKLNCNGYFEYTVN